MGVRSAKSRHIRTDGRGGRPARGAPGRGLVPGRPHRPGTGRPRPAARAAGVPRAGRAAARVHLDLAGDPDARGRRRRPRAVRLVPALDAVRGRAPHLALRQRLPQPPRRHQPHVEHLAAAAGPAAVAADPALRPGADLQRARHPRLRPLGLERLSRDPPLRAQPRRGRLRRAGLRLLAGDGRPLPPPQPDPDLPPAMAVRPARRDPGPPARGRRSGSGWASARSRPPSC